MLVMTRDEAVPEPAIRAVEALLPPGTRVETFPGQPRVAVTFADAAAGRKFASRQFVGALGPAIAIRGADKADPRVLHLQLGKPLLDVAAITPQVVMAFVGELRDWATDAAPEAVEVRTTPGQMTFDLAFATPAGLQAFLADWRAGPWPGMRYVGVNSHATLASGVRVDCVPFGVGTVLLPEVRFYKKHASPTTEVAIQSAFSHDLYLAMRPAQGQKFIHLLAVVFPFVSFLWLGAITMLFGAVVAMLPARRKPEEGGDDATAGPAEPSPAAAAATAPAAG